MYDGSAHGATGSCLGINGETLTGLNLGASFTDVPGGTATWSFTNTNYDSESGSVPIVINAWRLTGFYAPVDKGIHNTVKAGATVPLKFEAFAGATELTSTSVVKSFIAQKVTCGTGTLEDAIEEMANNSGTSLRYDATGGQFIQNWQTPKAAGSCYQVTMTTDDGSFISALFKLK